VSLIEEALRKQREENDKSGSVPNIPPPSPASHTEAPQEPLVAEEPSRRPWVMLAGIAGGGIFAILLIVWLVIYGLALWHNNSNTPLIKATISNNTIAASTKYQPATRTNDQTLIVTTPSNAPPPAVVCPVPIVQSASPPAQPSKPQTSISEPPAPVLASAAGDKANPEKTLPKTLATAKPPLPTIWPKLIISGIIGSSKNGRSAAIINGQMLSPGENTEGVTIGAIENQKVKLIFNGEVKTLSVGASTE